MRRGPSESAWQRANAQHGSQHVLYRRAACLALQGEIKTCSINFVLLKLGAEPLRLMISVPENMAGETELSSSSGALFMICPQRHRANPILRARISILTRQKEQDGAIAFLIQVDLVVWRRFAAADFREVGRSLARQAPLVSDIQQHLSAHRAHFQNIDMQFQDCTGSIIGTSRDQRSDARSILLNAIKL